MASEIVASSAHAIVIVYALTSASPETVFSCEPSLSVVSEVTRLPSPSTTETSSVSQPSPYWPAAQKPQVWDPSADWRPAAQSTHSVEPTVDA